MKEELNKKLTETIFETIQEKGQENIKEQKEKILKSIDEMLDSASAFIGITDVGIQTNGSPIMMLTLLSAFIDNLRERDIDEELILTSVKAGFGVSE